MKKYTFLMLSLLVFSIHTGQVVALRTLAPFLHHARTSKALVIAPLRKLLAGGNVPSMRKELKIRIGSQEYPTISNHSLAFAAYHFPLEDELLHHLLMHTKNNPYTPIALAQGNATIFDFLHEGLVDNHTHEQEFPLKSLEVFLTFLPKARFLEHSDVLPSFLTYLQNSDFTNRVQAFNLIHGYCNRLQTGKLLQTF